jgi:integrase
MSIFRRGNRYWFEFTVNGQRIRESAGTTSKTVAKMVEAQRRRQVELAANGLAVRRERPPLFKLAVRQWLDSRAGLAHHTLENYRLYAGRLVEHFGERLVSDIGERDIAALICKRQRQDFKARSINLELAVLRMVLRYFGLWDAVKGQVRPLREPHDVGRAISRENEEQILAAIRESRSPALLPLFVLAVDTGLRASELRHLRHRDLSLVWRDGAIVEGWLTVSKSKTEGGTGRTIPLTVRACATLSLWLARFPEAGPDAYVFPAYRIGFTGHNRRSDLYGVDLTRPIGLWKKAWRDALKAAGLHYRWHDLRHTFISRLAENPAVSEQTIMALAGHVSKAMLARYSHIRNQAKQAAIAALERTDFVAESPQNPPQSDAEAAEQRFTIPEKALN